jgi:hypothetical protein
MYSEAFAMGQAICSVPVSREAMYCSKKIPTQRLLPWARQFVAFLSAEKLCIVVRRYVLRVFCHGRGNLKRSCQQRSYVLQQEDTYSEPFAMGQAICSVPVSRKTMYCGKKRALLVVTWCTLITFINETSFQSLKSLFY